MGVAAFADDVHPLGFLRHIDVGTNVLLGDDSRETSVAAWAVKFGLGAEHRVAAAQAAVEARIVELEIGAVVGQIAGSFARDVKLLKREQLAPLRFGVKNFLHASRSDLLSRVIEFHYRHFRFGLA